MSMQTSISRICLRCRIQIFPSGFGQSILIPHSGYLLRHSSSYIGRPSARVSLQSPVSSTEGPGTRKTLEDEDILGQSPNGKKTEPDANVTNPEGIQRSHPLVMTDTIANLDAESFVSAAKARLKKAAEADPFDPLLSKQADEDFLKSYRSLLSDTRRDIQREINDSGEMSENFQESIRTPEGLKRIAIFWGKSATDANNSWPAELPSTLKGVASKFNFPPATHRVNDLSYCGAEEVVTLHGFLTPPRIMNKKLTFANFFDFHSGPKFQIQIVSNTFEDPTEDQIKAQETLMSMTPFTPVSLTGKIFRRESTRRNKEEFEYKATLPKTLVKREFSSRHPSERTAGKAPTFLEIHLQSLQKLNSVAEGLVYTPDTVFPPEQRHLQLRTKHSLYSALRLRAKVASICRNHLERNDFLEVETPLLFKSTPEGAREFLVPTRSKENGGGMCYALPQSPQQYKQILMASGVARYFQLAKCFRDEDLRADRQPEFTQLDLEMSFATGEDVMSVIEELLNKIWYETLGIDLGGGFQRMTWWYAMKFYGSDKPDLRFPKTKINEITSILPHLVKNKDEHIEVICLHADRRSDKEKIEKFRSSFEETHKGKGDDHFLSYVVGHPSAHLHPDLVAAKIDEEKIVEINREIWAPPGSIVIIKLRKGDLSGGSTKLGLLRTSLLAGAQLENLIKTPERPEFVWIIDFPLFSPSSDSEPGQSGTAGLSSTHHPFTAPNPKDLAMLAYAPAKVRGEHYDIVVNGVELGGGSRRIHDAELQKYVLESVLKVDPSRIHQFDHLLKVLGSGCPPHAGIALGFDRLIAILQGADSVRDVIAFPKSAKGADPLVGSPSLVSDKDLETYHLKKSTNGHIGQDEQKLLM